MSIIQAIIGTNLTISAGGGGGGGVTPDGTHFWDGSPIVWGSAGIDPNKPTYNATYNFPDGTTTGQMWDFNGVDNLMTTGVFSNVSQVYMNIWFYPTAAGRILMTIQGQTTENVNYHHAALTINGNDTITGGFWAGMNISPMTTANTVTLNAWNHIYFRHNGTQALLQLNGGTAVTATHSWELQSNPFVAGFGTTSITNNGISARYQGMLAEFRLNSSNTASNYDSTRSIYEAPQPFLYDDFTIEWWQKAEAIGVNTRPWAIGLLGAESGQVISLSYEGNGRDYFWINNGYPAQLADRPLKNHYGVGWEHMAIVRKDNVIKLFSNGTSYLTWSGGSQAITATNADLVIGTGEIPTGNFQGYIKDLHIIKGYAKYNANFTPPVLPVQPQTGTVFLLPVTSSGTAFDDVISYKAAMLTNTPTYSEDDPFTYPGATFTAVGYGNNLITPSPMPANLRVGLLVSDGSGWSDYVIDPNYYGNIKLSSLPASTPPELVYTVSEDLTSVTQGTNTYGGSGPNWNVDYSSTNFNVELLKVRVGWTVAQGETILGTVTGNAYLITPEVIRIGVDFDPATAGGLTFTYLPPTYGGSIRFDAGDYINYGSSVDWAFDIDDINTGSITLDLDANNTTSYSGTGTTWTDLSGNGNNATLINNPYWDNGPPGYFNFDGVNQYATVAGANIIPAAAYTKMVWFKIDTFSADNNLVSSDNGGHFMYFNQTNTLYAGHSNVLPYNAFGSTFHFSTDTWYCAVVTFSVANGIKLYINGVLDAQDATYQTPHNQNGNTNIACFGAGGNLLNGKIGRVLCYSKELTAGEVLQNFNATRNRYGI